MCVDVCVNEKDEKEREWKEDKKNDTAAASAWQRRLICS